MSEVEEGVIVVPANFGEPREPITGAGLGETFEIRCGDCGRQVASGLWDMHGKGIDFMLCSHALECSATSFSFKRWR